MAWPVQYAASSEARNTAMLATSRWLGEAAERRLRRPFARPSLGARRGAHLGQHVARADAVDGDAVGPSSMAATWVSEITAAFDAA